MKRLTQRCPANAQLSGNMNFTKLTAWRERSVEDGVTHSAQRAVGRCGLLKALDSHPVSPVHSLLSTKSHQDTPPMMDARLSPLSTRPGVVPLETRIRLLACDSVVASGRWAVFHVQPVQYGFRRIRGHRR